MGKRLVVLGAAVIAGGLVALNETRSHGYVVPYTIIGMFLITLVAVVISGVLVIFRKTRAVGAHGLFASVAFFVSFYSGIVIANHLGAWERPMIPIGPDVRANIVVVFRPSTTNDQINSFLDNVIGIPHPDGGHSHLPGMQSLLKVDVDGHEAYALGLARDITTEQKELILARIRSSPIVLQVFENVEPAKIQLPAG